MKFCSKVLPFFAVSLVLILAGIIFAGINPPTSTPVPTGYTLTDIYNLIHNNATTTHTLSPNSNPTATSSYSVSQIYADLANLIQRENVATGTIYLGITGSYGNHDASRPNTTIIPSSLTPSTGSPQATGYTLDDIYNLIHNTATTTHNFIPPGTPAPSLHTLTQIYGDLTSLINPAKVATGTRYLGKTGSYVLTYTITYDGNGSDSGTVPVESNTYASSSEVTVLDNTGFLAKTGYIFTGWNTLADGSGTAHATSSTFAMGPNNLTLYAQWIAWTCGNPIVDARDSKSYATVQIGSQCWIQQNINIGTMVIGANNQGSSCSSIEKYCYSNNEANCTTYGGLYQWDQAMCGSVVEGAQGICMTGWHVPTHDEFTTLERTTCTSGTCATDFPYDNTTVGLRGTNEGTTLQSGSGLFKALLAHARSTSGSFFYSGPNAYFWTSLQNGSLTVEAWQRQLNSGWTTVNRTTDGKAYGKSVRCLHN